LCWFHNIETLAATLSLSSFALEPNPVLPGVLDVEFVAAGRHCANVGLGRQSPATSHWRDADRNPFPSPHHLPFLCCLPLVLLRVYPFSLYMASTVKRAPCHVLETRMPHVMDGRVVSRGLCFTLGNPGPQPSCLAMVVAASLVHPS
jgi:hypothetical protein